MVRDNEDGELNPYSEENINRRNVIGNEDNLESGNGLSPHREGIEERNNEMSMKGSKNSS